MKQQKSKILWNKKIGLKYFKIGLTCSGYSGAQPGQFVMLRFTGQMDPLLSRPFSIHNLITANEVIDGIEILYKVVGKVTTTLTQQRPGDVIEILGPLGSGFVIPDRAQRIFLAAGGIGVAPMVFLVSRLSQKKIDLSNCRVFIGGRTKEDIICGDDFFQLGAPLLTTTDDGSAGDQCLVTHPLEQAVNYMPPDILFACGPMDMLSGVAHIAEKYEVPCQVSIETMMACGMGACLGCAVACRDDPDRYLHACTNGPVFDAGMLKF